jgi:FkbM family methyltransferase
MIALRRIAKTRLEMPVRAAIRLFRRRRDATIPAWQRRAERDDAYIDAILRKELSKSSNCIDVGAHRGAFLERFVRYAPQGRHIAIEPLPVLAAELRERFPQVAVHLCAVGDRIDRVGFCHVLNLPGWSGLKAQQYPVNSQVQTIEVTLTCIDTLVPPDYRADFIKIDVEGAELEVLRGARETILRSRPHILFEHARIHNTEYGTTPDQIYDVISEYGLHIRSLDGTGPLTRKEFRHIYEASFASNYDAHAQTNFIAAPQ